MGRLDQPYKLGCMTKAIACPQNKLVPPRFSTEAPAILLQVVYPLDLRCSSKAVTTCSLATHICPTQAGCFEGCCLLYVYASQTNIHFVVS